MIAESTTQPPSDPETLEKALETLRLYCGVVLVSFAKYGQGLRETIARNFVARGMTCTQGIFSMWKGGSDQDAWILHRALLERLLLLHHLSETDTYLGFEEYSFVAMYKARQQLLSDPDMKDKLPSTLKELQKANATRYEKIVAQQSHWQRPRPEDVARKMGLGFLYRFGYDYASTHVHPMAEDGDTDFIRLTSSHCTSNPLDETVILNSILVQTLLVQEALNVSRMRRRAIVYDFLEEVRMFLKTGNPEFHATFYKIASTWPDFQLCQPRACGDGA